MNPSDHPGQFLALDVGQKRTGIARASVEAKIAEPLITVDTAKIQDNLRELIDEYKADGLVIGLPRSLNGNETDQTIWVRQWAEQIKTKVSIPIFWQAEALSTEQAMKLPQFSKNVPYIDARAAAVILDDFLKTPVEDRVSS